MATQNREKKLAGRNKTRRYGSASRAFVEDMARGKDNRAAAAIRRSEKRSK